MKQAALVSTFLVVLASLFVLFPRPTARGATVPGAGDSTWSIETCHPNDPDEIPTLLRRAKHGRVTLEYRNLSSITAGDRFILAVDDDSQRDFWSDLILEPIDDRSYMATAYRPGRFIISYGGVETSVEAVGPHPPSYKELIGFGAYTLPYEWEDLDPYRFVDLLAEHGFNHTRIVVPSRSWMHNADTKPSPFMRRGRKFDLTKFDEEFLLRLQAFLYYALQRGVIVHIDLFDEVMLRYPEFWARSEWAAGNNVNGWITADFNPQSAFYSEVLSGKPSGSLQAMEGYFNVIASHVPQPHIIGDGNELSEIAFSHHFLSRYRGSNPLACGLSVLWMSGNDKTYDIIDGGPHSGEVNLRRIFSTASFLTLHNIQSTTLDKSFRRIEPVLQRYPRLKVIFSTDGAGAGSGLRKPHGSRPNVQEIREITERARVLAGEHFGGVEIKVLNFFDFRSLLEQLSGTIRPRN